MGEKKVVVLVGEGLLGVEEKNIKKSWDVD